MSMTTDATPASPGPVVLVTGATGGLGQVSARALADAGVTVLLLDRDEKKLNALYDEIVARGAPTPISIPIDLASLKDAAFEELATMIEVECGRLDGIAHLAAHFVQLAPLSLQRLSDWEQAFAVNVLAPFALTRPLLPLLRRAPEARVLFAVDSHSLHPKAFWGGFGSSQAAVVALHGILADEESAHPGFRTNLLLPGVIHSPMRDRTHPGETRAERRPVEELAPLIVDYFFARRREPSGELIHA
jgi:NAD(P)-dependent dehydrogenase (short-subunit alcohol dehydrogenase family)